MNVAAQPTGEARARAREDLRGRLALPDALLSRTDLADLGLGRRAVDAVFRTLPTIVLPGFSRPYVRVRDYLELIEASTYDGDRVRGGVQSPVIPPTSEPARLQGRSRPSRPKRVEGVSAHGRS